MDWIEKATTFSAKLCLQLSFLDKGDGLIKEDSVISVLVKELVITNLNFTTFLINIVADKNKELNPIILIESKGFMIRMQIIINNLQYLRENKYKYSNELDILDNIKIEDLFNIYNSIIDSRK